MQKRRMSAAARRQAIVKVALPLFARKGFSEVTTRELAHAAGVSEPLLYRHFPSKEAVYLEILEVSCQGIDPLARRLSRLEPSTSSLVHLVYCLLRALVLGRPAGTVGWDTRHRLMLKSFLEDGAYARLVCRSRLACLCSQIEDCLEAAIAAGDAVGHPVAPANRALFAHHLGAWLAVVHLPAKPVVDYGVSRVKLLDQAVWFALRGMGLSDAAIARHYHPQKLARFYTED